MNAWLRPRRGGRPCLEASARARRIGANAASRAPALLLAAGLALLSGVPGMARAQSYLSELPGQNTATPIAGGFESELSQAPLETLFQMVQYGQRHEAYPVLKARFEDEMRVAADSSGAGDAAALRRRYLLHLLRGGDGLAPPEEQERNARAFTDDYPDDDQFPVAFFYLNQALFQQGRPLEESFFFDREALDALPSWMQTRFLRMLAEHERRQGRLAEAATYLMLEMEREGTLRQTTQVEVEELLERMQLPAGLLAFLEQHLDVPWLQQRGPFLLAKVLYNDGQLDQALLALERILDRGQASSAAELKYVNDLKLEIRARATTRSDRIGVLLPLGSSAQVLRELALETLEGLRMAVQFSEAPSAGRERAAVPLNRLLGQDLAPGVQPRGAEQGPAAPRFELVIRDTANNPSAAARQVESLVQDDHVIAIIGPIARAESSAAAEKAEALGVPLISLSLSLDIPPEARFVFRHSKSQEEEVRDLVRYATSYLHARRFAILFPDTSYGQTMAHLFWREAEQQGGTIVAAATFEPSVRVSRLSQDRLGFKEIFERFTGLNRLLAPEEKALLEAVGDSRPDPVVDFDALFIPVGPDGVQDLQIIAPYPVTVDAEHVQLLGSRFWNDLSVLVAGDGKLDGAVFVDAFDLTSANPKVEAFHNRHRMFYGHQPQYRAPTYYAGLGYDTANLLMELLAEPRRHSRRALREALVQMEPYFGVTGWTRFNERGEAEKESMFFRIRNNEIVRVVP
jgi:ABC-type branched-subunit amino acid transport system substrate-binding protein